MPASRRLPRLALLSSSVALALAAAACSTSSSPSSGSSTSADTDPCATDGSGWCTTLPPTGPTACTSLGSVHFHLNVPSSEDAGDLGILAYAWATDPVNWFTVSTAAGDPVQIVPPTSDVAPGEYWAPSCSACESLPAIAAGQGGPILGSAGADGTWSGTSYSLTSTCHEAQFGEVPCGDVLCAPAGDYVVKMCAQTPEGVSTCVTVPFTFPGTPEVTGTLPQ